MLKWHLHLVTHNSVRRVHHLPRSKQQCSSGTQAGAVCPVWSLLSRRLSSHGAWPRRHFDSIVPRLSACVSAVTPRGPWHYLRPIGAALPRFSPVCPLCLVWISTPQAPGFPDTITWLTAPESSPEREKIQDSIALERVPDHRQTTVRTNLMSHFLQGVLLCFLLQLVPTRISAVFLFKWVNLRSKFFESRELHSFVHKYTNMTITY